MKKTIEKLKQFSVLYIEDNTDTANNVLRLYNSIFKKVHYYDNAKDALHDFKKLNNNIDLIVVEAQMPEMSGTKMVSHLRKAYGYNHHKIIFTINKPDDDIILKCLKLGATDYLIKDFQHNTHLGILIKVLKPIFDKKHIHKLNQELGIYKIYADSQLIISKSDLEGNITYVNDNFCEISKYEKSELIGNPQHIVRHPRMPKKAFEDMWNTISSGKNWNGNIQNKAKDGSSYFVEADIFPIKDKEGNVIEYMSFRKDVTSHITTNKKAKDVLKETKLNYSKIYEDSIEKAKIKVAKEFNNMEFSLNLERENSVKQAKKRALAEKKLNDTTDEKDKEIKKWKSKISLAGKTIESLNKVNKKLITDSRQYTDVIDDNTNKLNSAQEKINDLQKDKARLEKIIADRNDVISHLEDELSS